MVLIGHCKFLKNSIINENINSLEGDFIMFADFDKGKFEEILDPIS